MSHSKIIGGGGGGGTSPSYSVKLCNCNSILFAFYVWLIFSFLLFTNNREPSNVYQVSEGQKGRGRNWSTELICDDLFCYSQFIRSVVLHNLDNNDCELWQKLFWSMTL